MLFRLDFGHGDASGFIALVFRHLHGYGTAIGQTQRGLKAFGQALARLRPYFDAVHHDVNVVLFGLFQLGQVVEFIRLAVHAKAHIALRLHVGKHFQELALFFARERRQNHQSRVLRKRQHGIDHLAHGLRLQRQVMLGAMRCTRAGKQEAQVIVDFRHRAHGGARVVAGGFLLDGNGGRKALDHVHIRLVHQLQKLPRVGGQALHIAALAFGIQRVKRQ